MLENAVVTPVNALPSIAIEAPVSVGAFNVPVYTINQYSYGLVLQRLLAVERTAAIGLVIALSTSVFV